MKKTVSLLFLFLIVINVVIAVKSEEMLSELKEVQSLNTSEVGTKINNISKIKTQINDSEYIDTALDVVQGTQKLTLTFKDSTGNYIFDKDSSCSQSPKKKWNYLFVYIYNSSGYLLDGQFVACVNNFYLKPGDYKFTVDGAYYLGLVVEQSRDITILDAKDLDYTFVADGAYLELALKDSAGNYIYINVSVIISLKSNGQY